MGTLLTQVQINSIVIKDDNGSPDPKLLFNWEYERTNDNEISELIINVPKTITGTVTLGVGKTVEVWKGFTTSTDEKIFSGFISKFEPDGGIIKITCKDKLWDLKRKRVNKIYLSTDAFFGEVSQIAKDLIETFGGLTSDEQATGTEVGRVLGEFQCINIDIWSRLKALAKAVNYQLWYDAANDTVHFEPRGFNNPAITLTVGTEIISVPKWENDTSKMVNLLRVEGATHGVEQRLPVGTGNGVIDTTANFDTDGITLDFTPESVQLILENANPPTEVKIGGTKDSSTGHFYYVDKENKKVIPATGTTFTATHRAIVNYIILKPAPVKMRRQGSIDEFGTFEEKITLADAMTIADAEARTNEILDRFSNPFLIGEFLVKSVSSLTQKIGDIVTIVDTINNPNINQQLVITKQVIKYPGSNQELTVGDESLRLADINFDANERIRRLEEKLFSNQDLLQEIFQFNNTRPIKPRYKRIFTQAYNVGANVGIWGNSDHGTWGTELWGDHSTAFDAEADHFIQQFEDTYTENFIDDDFEGAGNASWSTTGSVTFTSGQIALSSSVDFNNSTITAATLTPTVVSGLFKYEMAADGTNFEHISIPIAHYKLNDNAANTTVLDNIGNFDGTLNGGDNTEDKTVSGKINSAFNFNGTDDYIDLGDPVMDATDEQLTLAMWIKPTSLASNLKFVGKRQTAGNNGYAFGFEGATAGDPLIFTINGVVDQNSDASGLTTNFHHVAVTYDKVNIKFYVDGSLLSTHAQTGEIDSAGATKLFFGATSVDDVAANFFNGIMDDVRIYNKALSLAEIQAIYNSGNGTEDEFFSHTFTNQGTDLRWKAIEINSTTGELSKVVINNYH